MRSFRGMYLAVLDYDVDAVVFAGGVGENDATVRREVTKGFGKIGLVIDEEKNEKTFKSKAAADISAPQARIRTFVVPTDEERVILEDVIGLLNGTYDVHTKFAYSFS